MTSAMFGSGGGTRTRVLRLMRPLSCRCSTPLRLSLPPRAMHQLAVHGHREMPDAQPTPARCSHAAVEARACPAAFGPDARHPDAVQRTCASGLLARAIRSRLCLEWCARWIESALAIRRRHIDGRGHGFPLLCRLPRKQEMFAHGLILLRDALACKRRWRKAGESNPVAHHCAASG